MNYRKIVWQAFAIALLSSAAPVLAGKSDFENCDGLRAPSRKGSGMAPPKNGNGFASFIPGRGSNFAQIRITACSAALQDPLLLPEHGLRRSYLLESRALAKLEQGDAAGALEDLDSADTAVGSLANDPMFNRSMGISLKLARAVVLQAKGDRASARKLATEAAASRPYSVSIQTLAALIAQRARDIGPGVQTASPFEALTRLNPEAVTLQFNTDIEAGRFATAAALYSRLKPAFPKSYANALQLAYLAGDARTLAQSVLLNSTAAYAFAATGKTDRAREILSDTKERLTLALATAKPQGNVPAGVNALAEPLNNLLERWSKLTEARIAVASGKPTEAIQSLVGLSIPVHAASVELLTALRTSLPEAQRNLAPDPSGLAEKLDIKRKEESIDVAALRRAIPVPETDRSLTDYQQAGPAIMKVLFGAGFSNDGFKSEDDQATGITTIEYVGQTNSGPVVEEMTLLRAADLARQRGKSAMLIVERKDYSRTLTTYRSNIPISSRPAGYKTELKVRFVDPTTLPAGIAPERERLLDANLVYSNLAPIYLGTKADLASR